MSETPKLHGWITPEYAEQMVEDLLTFLKEHGGEKAGIYDLAQRGIRTRLNQYLDGHKGLFIK